MKKSSLLSDRQTLAVLAFCLLFIALGLLFIPYPGLQTDEVIFTNGLYPPPSAAWYLELAGAKIPVMVMSYIGALKTWLYYLPLKLWAPSVYSIRIPTLLIGAATVWLLYLLLLRLSDRRSAIFGAALLAADTTFLLTTTFDWGPIAIHILLTTAALLLFVKFHQEGKNLYLAAAFFLLGLALWNKGLYLWTLAGLGAATLAVCIPFIRRHISFRRLALSCAGFCLGALPLILYNFAVPLGTIQGNAKYDLKNFWAKLVPLERTIDGSALLGYLSYETPPAAGFETSGVAERASLALDKAVGGPRRNLYVYAVLASLLLAPFLWRTPELKPYLFALLAAAFTWAAMAITREAGASAHHAVLLNPFPHIMMALAFAAGSRSFGRAGRLAVMSLVAVICASGLLATNHHLSQFVRNGAANSWTDAIFPLAEHLESLNASKVVLTDWGMVDNLRALSEGRLPLHDASHLLTGQPGGADSALHYLAGDTGAVFVRHSPEMETMAGVNGALRQWTDREGYRRTIVARVFDRHNRLVYEVLRLEK